MTTQLYLWLVVIGCTVTACALGAFLAVELHAYWAARRGRHNPARIPAHRRFHLPWNRKGRPR